MKSLFLLILINCFISACPASEDWSLDNGIYIKRSVNPSYECGKEFKISRQPGTEVRGCHAKLGDVHFVILPQTWDRDYACIREHEFKHVNGWEHDENYLERCL